MERRKEEARKIGKEIKKLRENAKLVQADVSKLLGISDSHYSRMELGNVDIRTDKQKSSRRKLIELFPELEEIIKNISDNSNIEENDKTMITSTNNAVTGIYDPLGINKEVALDKEDAKVISDKSVDKLPNLTEPVKISISDNKIPLLELDDYSKRNEELNRIMKLIKMDSTLSYRNLAILNAYQKFDIEGLKKFIPTHSVFDFAGDNMDEKYNINDIELTLPKHMYASREYKNKKATFMNSILNKETEADKTAKENFQLVLFDSIHNKIMYYITNNLFIEKKDLEIIKAEIRLYVSITGDTSNILDLKVSNIKLMRTMSI